MKKVVKTSELLDAIQKANQLRDIHGINYAFRINKPLNGDAYELFHDDHIVMKGTKKEIFSFLKTFVRVLNYVN